MERKERVKQRKENLKMKTIARKKMKTQADERQNTHECKTNQTPFSKAERNSARSNSALNVTTEQTEWTPLSVRLLLFHPIFFKCSLKYREGLRDKERNKEKNTDLKGE